MARKPRFSPGNIAYHVMNRTWGNLKLFEDDPDYQAFERVLAQACEREESIRLCAYCLMPNHFHLVLYPAHDGQLSRFMQWLTMTHVQRWHAHRHTGGRGHLYQSRFKSFPIQQDAHFLKVCRYVERNPLRAKLVKRVEKWPWSSLWQREHDSAPLKDHLANWPVKRPANWIERVNQPQDEKELDNLRQSTQRGRPYGAPDWSTRTAKRLNIESSLRPVGRPVKTKAKGKITKRS
jgi:putative transposase